MSFNLKVLLVFSIGILLLTSCSSDDDSSSIEIGNFGTIQLSGPDTAIVGTSLQVGNIDEDGLGSTGTSSAVVLLDPDTSIVDGELIPTNFESAFVIIAAQFTIGDSAAVNKAISMVIIKNAQELSYVCTTPADEDDDEINCGNGFTVDKAAKIVTFDNTTVINQDNGNILTMNGVINYN